MAHHAQIMYDHSEFCEEFMHLPSQALALASAPEWVPSNSLSLIRPSTTSMSSTYAAESAAFVAGPAVGTNDVLSIDISSNLLHEAEQYPASFGIYYLHAYL